MRFAAQLEQRCVFQQPAILASLLCFPGKGSILHLHGSSDILASRPVRGWSRCTIWRYRPCRPDGTGSFPLLLPFAPFSDLPALLGNLCTPRISRFHASAGNSSWRTCRVRRLCKTFRHIRCMGSRQPRRHWFRKPGQGIEGRLQRLRSRILVFFSRMAPFSKYSVWVLILKAYTA